MAMWLGLPVLLRGDKLLNPFAVFHFTGVDVSLGVHGDRIDPMELSRITAVASKGARQSAVVTIEDPDHIVCAVRNQDVLLLRVRREGQIVDRSTRGIGRAPDAPAVRTAGLRRWMNPELFYKFALFREDLDSVAAALADVDESIS